MKKIPKFLHSIDPKRGREFVISTISPAFICEIFTVSNKETIDFDSIEGRYVQKKNRDKLYVLVFNRFANELDILSALNEDFKPKLERALTWYLQAIIKKEDKKNER